MRSRRTGSRTWRTTCNAVAALFKERDPIRIIKFKEIIERLEEATDYCEDVADILSDIVAKNR
jgi:hypothetical protein